MGSPGPSALLGMVFSGRLFELIADARRTVAERFDAVFGETEAAKVVLGAPIAYFDDDPEKVSFLLFAGVWSRYVESGSYYFKGGSRALAFALLKHVKEGGGDARYNCSVVSILLDAKGRAAGVAYEDRTGDRSEALAPIIFAGAASAVLAEMLPDDKRETFAHQFAKFEPSISLFNVSLGLSRPASEFGVSAYSTFIYPDDMKRYSDFPRAAAIFGQEPSGAMPLYVIADYGRLDAELHQPQDQYLVSVCGVDRLAWWEGLDEAGAGARRKRWIDAACRRRRSTLSGLRGRCLAGGDCDRANDENAPRHAVWRRSVDQLSLHGVRRLFRRDARRAHGCGRRLVALRRETSVSLGGVASASGDKAVPRRQDGVRIRFANNDRKLSGLATREEF